MIYLIIYLIGVILTPIICGFVYRYKDLDDPDWPIFVTVCTLFWPVVIPGMIIGIILKSLYNLGDKIADKIRESIP